MPFYATTRRGQVMTSTIIQELSASQNRDLSGSLVYHIMRRTSEKNLTQSLFGKFWNLKIKYRKIPIISPGLKFVQKAFLLGLSLGELIFGGGYYWKEFCVSKWVGLDNKNSLKHFENRLKQLV